MKQFIKLDKNRDYYNVYFLQILNRAGYTHSIYATFNNGLAYEFIEGETLTVETVRNPPIYELVAKRMAQMHKLKPIYPEMSQKPFVWSKTESFLSVIPKTFSNREKQLK